MQKTTLVVFTIILLIASCSKKSAPTASKKIVDGASVYSANCAGCHGPEGIKGNKPNLQTIDRDKASIIHVVTKGKEKMPAFEDKLSADQIAAVADVIVGWHKK